MADELTERRRVRTARSVLDRISSQREWFATAYAHAATPQQRFTAAATALRSAAASKKQRHPDDIERRLDVLTGQIVSLLNELHTAQQDAAEKTLRSDAARIARNDRRRTDDRTRTDGTGRDITAA